jgi:hypothetical protein
MLPPRVKRKITMSALGSEARQGKFKRNGDWRTEGRQLVTFKIGLRARMTRGID